MMVYGLYPAVDNATYQFPPVIRQALAESPELHHLVIPMTEIERNELTGAELWNGRLIFNTTSNKINYYNNTTHLWYEIDLDKLSLDGGSLLGPLTLSGEPSLADHAANKQYVDDRVHAGRNRIINGDFSVNQRAFTSITQAAPNHGFDRWLMTCGGGTFNHVPMVLPNGTLPESAKTVARTVFSGGSAAGDYTLITQRIENVRSLSGKQVTVSFWARANVGTPKIAVDLGQYFGTGGSPSAEVNTLAGRTPALTTLFQRYSFTVTLPTMSGKTLGTNNDDRLALYLWFSNGSNFTARAGVGVQSGEIDLWGVQVEEGSIATPFEQKSYADELRACQRYFLRLTNPNTGGFYPFGFAGSCRSTTQAFVQRPLSVPMRIPPSLSFSAGATFHTNWGANSSVMSAIAQGEPNSETNLSLCLTVASAIMTAGMAANLWNQSGSIAYIDVSAEY